MKPIDQGDNGEGVGIQGEGVGIQDAIAAYLVSEAGMDMHPMVGNFTLIAEVVDPDTGQLHVTAIQTEELPYWTEYGMLGLRMNDVATEWQSAGLADYIENIDEEDE